MTDDADNDFPVPDWVRVGTVFRMYYGPHHHGNRRIHIRAIVDGDQVVYRYWSAVKGWIYGIEADYLFGLYEKSSHFILVKRG